MINFKDRAYVVPSALILLSILILAGTLLFMVFVPPPSVAGLARGQSARLEQTASEIKAAKERTALTRTQIVPLVWAGGSDTVSGAVLEQLTAQARQQALSLSAFRPQRPQDLGGLTELPYSVQLSGSYGGIHAVMASLDTPGSKVVLRSFQVASAAAGSGVVATLGVSAYLVSDPTLVPVPAKAGKHA